MERTTRLVAGRALFVALIILAAGGATWKSGFVLASEQDRDPEKLADVSFSAGAWTKSNPNGSVAIAPDGVFWVGKTTKKSEAGYMRQVFRFKANRLPATGTSTPYSLRFTGKSEAGQFSKDFETRPRPIVRPSMTGVLEEETNEMGMVMPDEGVVVINGTAPLISVKKATVSSVGTKFAIEANPSDWLLTVLETNGTDKVLIHFPESRTPPRELNNGESIRFGNGVNTPGAGVMETGSAASVALRDYAIWILDQTP